MSWSPQLVAGLGQGRTRYSNCASQNRRTERVNFADNKSGLNSLNLELSSSSLEAARENGSDPSLDCVFECLTNQRNVIGCAAATASLREIRTAVLVRYYLLESTAIIGYDQDGWVADVVVVVAVCQRRLVSRRQQRNVVTRAFAGSSTSSKVDHLRAKWCNPLSSRLV